MGLWIFLRLSPLPPQLIFQLYTFSTGERARVRGRIHCFLVHRIDSRSAPSSGLSATFSPLQAVDFVRFTNPKRQRGKQVTSALPREVFASLALRVSVFCGGFVAGDDRKSKIRNFKKR